MGKEDKIYNKIKDSFEQNISSAPENIWDNISKELDYTPNIESDLDKKIKTSFESVKKNPPEHIWQNINKQLTIDTVWTRISKILDRRQLAYKFRKVAASVLLLLLLLGSFFSYKTYLNDNNRTLNKTAVLPYNKNISDKPAKSQNNPILSEIIKPKNETSKKGMFSDKKIAENKSEDITYDTNTNNNNTSNNNIKITGNAKINLNENENEKTEQEPLYIPGVLFSEIKNIKFSFPEITTANGKRHPKPKYKPFSAGLIYQYDNTWLINNETRAAFDKTSLISSGISFVGNSALVINYSLTPFNEIYSEFYINDKIIQDYGTYVEGKYINKKIELNYLKFALMYKQNFYLNIKDKKLKFTASSGIYASKLKTEYKYSNNEIISVEKKYDNLDYGLKISTGKETDLGRFILGYGINTEYGLKNIFTGNEKIKSAFDDTRTAKIGAYISLTYKIF